jgi:hypothetical protein
MQKEATIEKWIHLFDLHYISILLSFQSRDYLLWRNAALQLFTQMTCLMIWREHCLEQEPQQATRIARRWSQ